VHGQDGAVAGVIAASTAAGSMLSVTGSTSTSRVGPQVARHLHRGGEGQRGRDHLVARPDADGLQRQVQAGGGGVDGDGLQATTQVVGKFLLEGLGLRPGRHPARAQRARHGIDLGLPDVGAGEGRKSCGFMVVSAASACWTSAGSYRFISV
jgi:hypothetical protein